MSKFGAFAEALRSLCRQHHVVLAPAGGSMIGVRDVDEGDEPVSGLLDLTAELLKHHGSPANELPAYFLTVLAAKQATGFVDYSMIVEKARTIASGIPGARVVPVGSPNLVRCWVVIGP